MRSLSVLSFGNSRASEMALSQALHEKKRMGPASHLLTPEEPTIDSFENKQPVRPIEPRSPPESPAFRPLSTIGEDPVLYPGSDHDQAATPLFDTNATPRATPDPIASSSAPVTLALTASSSEDPVSSRHWVQATNFPQSSGAIGFVQRYNANPVGYWKECMAQIEDLKRAKLEARKLPLPTTLPATRDSHTARLLESLGRSRVTKPNQAAANTLKTRTEKTSLSPRRSRVNAQEESCKSQPSVRRHSRQTSTPANATTQPKPRTRQPPSKVVERKDQLWTEIPDYCPPITSLDGSEAKLRCDWGNKNAQDLSQDPDLLHLHPQERQVASILRLKCDKYLQVKRLIFQEKVKFLKENKDFNKTSAQNCASVDVNKVSKLWQSFNDVGWFDRHWFEKYLD